MSRRNDEDYDISSKVKEIPTAGKAFGHRYVGPYEVVRKIKENDCIIRFPEGRRKEKKFHVNNLKRFYDNVTLPSDTQGLATLSEGEEDLMEIGVNPNLKNSYYFSNPDLLFQHIDKEKTTDLLALIQEFPHTDTPSKSKGIKHVIKLKSGQESPIKIPPNRMNPRQKEIMEKEVDSLITRGLAAPSISPRASPSILVKKADGTHRLCTDYRKLNQQTIIDSYPLPRVDDIIDEVASFKILTKLNLKGFYQTELEEESMPL